MVTARELYAFLEVVDAEIVQIHGSESDYRAFIDDDGLEEAAGIEVEWLGTRNNPAVIRCAPREVGARGSLAVEAPAPQWRLTQTIDDHNLLTKLELSESERGVEASVSVYGPPADHTPSGLTIPNGGDNTYVLEDVLASIDEPDLDDE